MKSFHFLMIFLIALLIIAIGWLLFAPSSTNLPVPAATSTVEVTFPTTTTQIGLGIPKTFDMLLTKPPTAAFEKVLSDIHLDVYKIISCKQNGQSENVVLFTAKYTQDPKGNNFDAAVADVKDWEPYMLKDIGEFIFPGVPIPDNLKLPYFTDVAITNKAVLPTTVRRATISLAGKDTFIHYGWLLNYVMFSSSQACLEEAMSTVYPMD